MGRRKKALTTEHETHVDEVIAREYARWEADPDRRVQHSTRFRKVSNRYPHMVAMAYCRDLGRAAAASDEEVAAAVAAWEHVNGWPVRDWRAIGAEERAELIQGAWAS